MTGARRLMLLLRPVRAIVPWALAGSAVVAASQAAYAYLVGPVLRFVFTGEQADHLMAPLTGGGAALALAGTVVLVSIVKGAATFGSRLATERLSEGVALDLRRRLHERLLCLPADFFPTVGRGDLVSRATTDVDVVKTAVTDGLGALARDALQAVALVAVALSIDPWMSLLAVLGVPPLALLVVKLGRRVRTAWSSYLAEDAAIADAITDATSAATAVRAYDAAPSFRERFARRSLARLRAGVRAAALQAFAAPLVELLGAVALGGGIVYARLRIDDGSLAPEQFLSFFAAILLLYRPLKGLGLTGTFLQGGVAALDRIEEILAVDVEPVDAPDAETASPLSDRIVLSGVAVRRGRSSVLSGVDLEIRAGELLGVVGASGVGKSTLAAVLLRLVEPDQGAILWDGVDVRRLRRASVRKQFALVTQEPLLVHDSVRANVVFGAADGDDARVWRALEMAGADALVRALPAGLDAMLGEGGGQLSAGERQRLCIARAFYRDPAVLVLDEATANLDSESETAIRAVLCALMKDRTVLLIAHRLATVKGADRIVVLEGGRVVEEGTHSELWEARGAYRRLFADQARS